MNKHFYRIVFNRARGQLMVVQECASAHGGGGASGARAPAGACEPVSAAAWPARLTALAAALAGLLVSTLTLAQGLAPAAHAPAGQRPLVDAARNGVPVVHIASPTPGGVSRNAFDEFNVGGTGLILNNSAGNVQTTLGGWIAGNPQLGPVPARVIVDEVTGANPSQLLGAIEVAGPRADVVIANPNGITCDGCGFLNTGRATLTTGQPLFDGSGGLQSLAVTQGSVHVGAQGLDASALEQLDLVARGLVVEGTVWAQQLNVVAGAGLVSYGSLQASPGLGVGPAPALAIDVKQLGGMVANQVFITANEKGLGVNSQGRLVALQGNLRLSADGDLTLGDTYASQTLQVDAGGNAVLTGQTASGGDAQVRAAGTLTNSGQIDVQGVATLQMAGLNNSGSIVQRSDAQPLTLATAGDIANSGTVSAPGALVIDGAQVTNHGGTWSANGDASVTSLALDNAQGSLLVGGNLSVATSGLVNDGGTLASDHGLSVTAADFSNRQGFVSAAGPLALNLSGALDNAQGTLVTTATLQLQAASATNAGGRIVSQSTAPQALSLLAGAFDNRQGVLASAGGARLQAGTLSNAAGRISANASLSLGAVTLDNDGGTIASNADLGVQANELDNHGGQLSAQDVRLVAGAAGVHNEGGRLVGQNTLAIQASTIANQGGLIASAGAFTLGDGLGDVDNTGGVVQSGATLAVQGTDVHNAQGRLTGSNGVQVVASGIVDNRAGEIGAPGAGDVAIIAGTALHDEGGHVTATDRLDLAAPAVFNDGGELSAGTDVAVVSGLFEGGNGLLRAGRDLCLQAGTTHNDHGNVLAGRDLALAGATLTQGSGATLAAGRDLNVDVSQSLTNAAGTLSGGGNARIRSGAFDNTGGTLTALGSLTVDTQGQTLTNTSGHVLSGGTLSMATGDLVNASGQLTSNEVLTLASASLDNTGGALDAVGAATLTTGVLTNDHGTIAAGGLTISSAALSNVAGTLGSQGVLVVDTHGQTLDNTAGSLQATQAATLRTGALTNAGGTVALAGLPANAAGAAAPTGVLDVAATGKIDNTTGKIDASTVNLDAGGQIVVNDGGRLVAAAGLKLTAESLSNAQAGLIAAGQDASLSVSTLTNANGLVQAGNDLTLAAGDVTSHQGQLVAGRDLTLAGGALSQDQSATIAAGRDIAVTLSQGLSNTGGASVAAQGGLDVHADSLINDGGSLTANGTLGIATAQAISNQGGTISGATAQLASRALNNSGGTLAAQGSLAIDTRSQDFTNSAGHVLAGGALTVQAGALHNDAQGLLSAGTAATLTLSSLDNRTGTIEGGGAVSLQSAGVVDNTGGRLAATGALTLAAGDLVNESGQIAGNSTVTLTANSLANHGGSLSAVGALKVVSAGAVDNSAGQVLTNDTLALSSASLDNTTGTVAATGAAQISVAGALTNDRGSLAANGLSISAVGLSNVSGGIGSQGALTLDTNGQTLENTGGIVQAAQAATLRSGALTNVGGQLLATGALQVTASGTVDNSGGQISGADLSLDAAGQQITNDGGRLVAQGSLELRASALSNARAGLIAANQYATLTLATLADADGTVQAGNDLTLAVDATSSHHGQLAAGRDLSVTGTALSQDASATLSAGRDLTVTLSQGLSNTAGAGMTAQGELDVHAASLVNDGGTLSANASATFALTQSASNRGGTLQSVGALDFEGTTFDNTGGTVLSSAAVGLNVGTFVNQGGTLAAGTALSVHAGDIDNTHGGRFGADQIAITATSLDDTTGAISAQHALGIDLGHGALTNAGGQLQSAGTLLVTSGAADNTGGVIAANGAATLSLASLDNHAGTLSSGDALTLALAGDLRNASGTIAAAGDLAVTAARLADNSAGGQLSAGHALTITAADISNAGGLLVAQGDVAVTGAFDNHAGTTASLAGSLHIDTAGAALGNDGGRLQAAQALSLSAADTSNRAGMILGQDTTVHSRAFDNTGGQLVALGKLDATTAAFTNDTGLVQAGGDLSLDTQSQTLVNTHAGETGGFYAGGQLSVKAGALVDTQGVIASTGAQHLQLTGALDNTAGRIFANGDLQIDAASLTNAQSGLVSTLGALTAALAGTLDNRGGQIAANGLATLRASTVDNSAGGSLQAGALDLHATSLLNANGTIVGTAALAIDVGTLDNTNGSLQSQGTATVHASAFDNTGGRLVADGGVALDTDSAAFGGTVSSQSGIDLTVHGGYTNTGTITSAGNLGIHADAVTNSGTLTAAQALSISATGNLVNSGQIDAATTLLSAGDTLTNSGLIDGQQTQVSAGRLANTGRLYGDQLLVQADALVNSAGGTVAARATLTLDADHVSNSQDGLLYSLGDLGIAGRSAADAADVTNFGATIEAEGNLSIASTTLSNLNAHVTYTTETSTLSLDELLIQPDGSTQKIAASSLGWDPTVDIDTGAYVLDSTTWPLSVYGATAYAAASTTPTGDCGQDCSTVYKYAPGDPIWARFGVTAPDPGVPDPTLPPGTTCENDSGRDMGGACGTYWNAKDDYDQHYAQAESAASAALQPLLDAFNADVASRDVTTWTEYHVTSESTSTPALQTTDPGRILARGDLVLSGSGAQLNQDSQVVAGGALIAPGLTNQATKATESVTDSGTARTRTVKYDGSFEDRYSVSYSDPVAFTDAPTLQTVDVGQPIALGHAPDPTQSVAVGAGSLAPVAQGGQAGAALGDDRSGPAASSSGAQLRATIGVLHGNDHAGTAQAASVDDVAAGTVDVALAQAGAVTLQGPQAAGTTARTTLRTIVGASVQVITTTTNLAPPGTGPRAASATAANAPTITRVAQAAGNVLTLSSGLALPSNHLFGFPTKPNANYLVETDPQFTDGRQFLGSDYLEQELGLDPSRELTRYGDGFAEQQLVDDQVLALTGREYLSGYAGTQAEYQALMDAGAAFARQYQLTPGAALSAAQMALLTTDIVWLTTKTVTLADGTQRHALVPQVYLRRPQDGDLQPSGALVSGTRVQIASATQLTNSGTILGDQVLLRTGTDVVNSGEIRGQQIALQASNDIQNLGGSIIGVGDESSVSLLAGRDIVLQTTTLTSSAQTAGSTASRTSVDRVATVQGGNVSLDAARDLVAQGAVVSATSGTLLAQATRDVDVGTVTQQHSLNIALGGASYSNASETTNAASALSAAKNLVIAAGGQLTLAGAKLNAGQDALLQGKNVDLTAALDRAVVDTSVIHKGSSSHVQSNDQSAAGTTVQAGGNLAIQASGNATLTAAQLSAQGQAAIVAAGDITIGAQQLQHSSQDESTFQKSGFLSKSATSTTSSVQWTTLAGSTVSGNTLVLQAGDSTKGTGDLSVVASTLQSTGAAALQAGHDLSIEAGQQTSQSTSSTTSAGHSLATRTASNASDVQTQSVAVGSTVSVGSLQALAGHDLLVQGSNVVADGNVALQAGNALTLTTAQDTTTDQSASATHKSGDIGSFLQPAIGVLKESTQGTSKSTTQVGSQVASLNGSITELAGGQYTQDGSALLASQGDATVQALHINIGAAFDQSAQSQHEQMSKLSIGGAISNPILDAARSVTHLTDDMGRTKDGRLQALAALDSTWQVGNAAKGVADMAANGASARVELSLGSEKSDSSQTSTSSTAVGSQIVAGGNLTLRQTGTGAALNVVGTDLKAGGTAALISDGTITLAAAQNTQTTESTNHSSSASVGVGFSIGQDAGVTLDLGASMGKGLSNGTATTWTNSHVDAGKVVLQSGGDTTLQGAVVNGDQVQTQIGGQLNLKSLQDTVTFDGKQTSASVGASLCMPPLCTGASSVSGSFAHAQVNGDYTSVGEQTGLHAGDGGFQVNVKGGTTLTGAVITSSQAAVAAGKNSLSTATLTHNDLYNQDDFKGTSVGVAASVSGGGSSNLPGTNNSPNDNPRSSNNSRQQLAAGIGLDSGHQSSTTLSGISGGTITITDPSAQQRLTGTATPTLDRNVLTGTDTSGHLTQSWNGQQALSQVQANERITQAAMPALANAIGDYASKQTAPTQNAQLYLSLLAKQNSGGLSDSEQQAFNGLASAGITAASAQQILDDPSQQATYDNWKEGGLARVGAHTLLGALGGGLSGALGGGLSAAATPAVADQVAQLNLPDSARNALIAGFGAVAGSVGGLQGATAGFDIVTNNYLRHDQVDQMMAQLKSAQTQQDRDAILARYTALSAQQDQALNGQCINEAACAQLRSSIQDGTNALNANAADLAHQMGSPTANTYTTSTLGGVPFYSWTDPQGQGHTSNTKPTPTQLGSPDSSLSPPASANLDQLAQLQAKDLGYATTIVNFNNDVAATVANAKAAADAQAALSKRQGLQGAINGVGDAVTDTVKLPYTLAQSVQANGVAGTIQQMAEGTVAIPSQLLDAWNKGDMQTVVATLSGFVVPEALGGAGSVVKDAANIAKDSIVAGSSQAGALLSATNTDTRDLGRAGTSAVSGDVLSGLTSNQLAALRNAGLNDAEIASHIQTLGDVQLFRGTTTGFAGNPVLQQLGITPASTDPLVATVFALEGRAVGGDAVVLTGGMKNFGAGDIDLGNVRSSLEREVQVNMQPSQFESAAPNSIPVDVARQALSDMGVAELPAMITSPQQATQILEATSRLTPAQIQEFLALVGIHH